MQVSKGLKRARADLVVEAVRALRLGTRKSKAESTNQSSQRQSMLGAVSPGQRPQVTKARSLFAATPESRSRNGEVLSGI